ncbi:hypothetical protein AM493_12975 [Flavobacterium akiainvivens]|uniref:Secretion system C-terminal sorting domain-containing protein n=1 Tax=Flavobacterium akiainvivens TaxID=1202724 RepID=A0A0M9VIM9_9FLAO|nr:ELWxxDGT repeat protein [Flavobacterium akiainvivens]KOS06836.1 hypothetical protein AM493_12975 [Flavobacterium akiainvivens]SFQ75054.1 Por secretion system C-terminal sorting domain-containing protein [Flavobacterium akiainvivens]
MKKILLLVLGFTGFFANAQTVNADLIELNFAEDGYPMDVTLAPNGKIYFSAHIGSGADRSLYVYDEQTGILQNLPSAVEGMNTYIEDGNFKMVGNTLFFTHSGGSYQYILFKSDGTPEGTQPVKIISSNGGGNTSMDNFTAYNGSLFFTAKNEANGVELWTSDGTEAGTHIVKDINPGVPDSYPSSLFVFNGLLYFNAVTVENGYELWKTDGTEEGTTMVKDMHPGPTGGAGGASVVFNNHFYFSANDGVNGYQLWESDGTSQGTQMFTTIAQEGINGGISNITLLDNYFVFQCNIGGSYHLWRSDGTVAGTYLLKAVNPLEDGFTSFDQFAILNNQVYFVGDGFLDKTKLWKTDGTVAGTQQVVNMEDISGGNIYKLTSSGGYLIFSSPLQGQNNSNPWVSNGTSTGTQLLNNLNLNVNTGGEMKFTPVGNNIVYFQVDSDLNGVELWKTDGTAANTQILVDVSHRYSGLVGDGVEQSAQILNDKLVFMGNDGVNGQEPFVTDGTYEGTYMLNNIYDLDGGGSIGFTNESNTGIFTKAGDKLFFNARNNEHGGEIYVTDGTAGGTVLVKDIRPGAADAVTGYTYFMEYNGVFYFKANDGVHGNELWRSDGTEVGTYLLKDIYPGLQSGITAVNSYTYISKNCAVFNGFLYFVADDDTGTAVWRTDGTEGGTVKVITLLSDQGVNNGVTIIGATDDKLYLLSQYVYTSYDSNTLWSSDGTQDGTMIVDSYLITGSTQFKKTCILNNELYYNVWTNQGCCIYKTDGSVEGTVLVKSDLIADNKTISFMKPCGDRVYFGVTSGLFSSEHSRELWSTDGTESGTVQLGAFNENNYDSFTGFSCYNGDFLYTRYNSKFIYVTNGDTSSTQSIEVLVNGMPPFGQYEGINSILGVIGGKVYMDGSYQNTGRELYVANMAGFLDSEVFNPIVPNTVSNFILYPNPSNVEVKVQTADSSILRNVSVYDFTGKKIFETEANNSATTIDINLWSNGIYIVKAKSDNGTFSQKFIKN